MGKPIIAFHSSDAVYVDGKLIELEGNGQALVEALQKALEPVEPPLSFEDKEQITRLAAATVARISKDLRGRSGFDGMWDGTDEDIRAEIEREWTTYVADSLFMAAAAGITMTATQFARSAAITKAQDREASRETTETTLATEATRWSRCEGSTCAVVIEHHDGEPPIIPTIPCGCGEHDIRLDRKPGIHWLGEHWDTDCAFRKATKLLEKALDAKGDDDG
jgi:hypothetical protein